jgi:hypothetical protein
MLFRRIRHRSGIRGQGSEAREIAGAGQ